MGWMPMANYYRARYYDPSIGRFISEDPIGLLGGTDLYLYSGDNPTDFVDPFGEQRGVPPYWYPPQPPPPTPTPTPPYVPPQPPNPVGPPPYEPYFPPVTHPNPQPEPHWEPPDWPPFGPFDPFLPFDPLFPVIDPCVLEPWICGPMPLGGRKNWI
jgi:hypothetical protein